MTREEAIHVLEKYTDVESGISKVVAEAHKLAIKALEQEPCTDAISRTEALKHSFPIFDDDGVGYMVVRADKIEQLPPVTPQTCEDAISRQAVIEELPRRTMKNYFGEVVGDVVYIDDINALPPVKPTEKVGHWIPVSEELPDYSEEVIFCTKRKRVHSGKYSDNGSDEFWYSYKNKDFVCKDLVVAWMPLPESYKQEEKE